MGCSPTELSKAARNALYLLQDLFPAKGRENRDLFPSGRAHTETTAFLPISDCRMFSWRRERNYLQTLSVRFLGWVSGLPLTRLGCNISLHPRKPVQQPGMVLTVASRLDLMYTRTPRILRCFPTVKLCVAVGEAEIAALGMAVGGCITP